MNPETKNYIEQSLSQLTSNIDLAKFSSQLRTAIEMKKNSTITEEEFLVKMLVNIEYFKENKKAWKEIFQQNFLQGTIPKVKYIQNELLLEQMKIRENLTLRMSDLIKKFKSQAISQITISDDYAFASIENSLRMDIITLFAMNQQSQELFNGLGDELLNFIDNQIDAHVSRIVNQLELT